MRFWRTLLAASVGLASLSLGAWRASGQQEDTAPKPAAHAIPPIPDPNGEQDADQGTSDAMQPDTRPLTGIQTLTLGSTKFRHSFWAPGFELASTIQSANPTNPQGTGWSANNYFLGTLGVLDTWRHSQLSLNYSGGGFFSTDSSLGSGDFQQLGLLQTFDWGRWKVSFLDQFSYLPESQFGFGGVTNLQIPGADNSMSPSLPGLGDNIAPTQNILGSTGPRYSNAFAAEATYAITMRASITMAGSYGILHFVDSGSLDTNNAIGSVGFNYELTRRNTIGVLYRFTGYHFSGSPQAFGDSLVNIAYGRKVTGRLAMDLSGGPEFVNSRIPLDNQPNRVLWSGSANLTYGIPRGGATLSFFHGVSGGSGILVGSNTDQLTVGANRQIGRLWSVLGSFGYAHNRNLAAANLLNIQQNFNSWFVTAGLARPLRPNTNLTFGYTARIQASTGATCPSGVCGANFTQHLISVGFQWNTRPFVIR
jgi:hypothetical protein